MPYRNLSINVKLFAVILAELVISTVLLATYSVSTIQEMTHLNIARYEEQVMASKKEALKNYVDLAKAVLQIYRDKVTPQTTPPELEQIKADAVQALDSMTYGDDDGYIFVWSYEGVPLAFNPRPELIGKKLIDLKGGDGKWVIRDHIENAKKGGGHFYRYKWKTTKDSPYQTKLSYSFGVQDWGWFVGTGEYLAREEQEIAYKQDLLQQNTNQLIKKIMINASILVLITSSILFYIIRGIIFTPLRNLSTGLNAFFLFLQNRKQTITPIPVTSHDEIGTMAQEINDSIQITAAAHKKLQEINTQLKLETQRFELAVQGADNGIFDWNVITNEVYFSPRWKSILGYQDDEIENSFSAWEQRTHPEDLQQVFEAIDRYLKRETEEFHATFRMRHKDQSWIWIQANAKANWDTHSNPTRMVGFHTDVSELIEYRQQLEHKVQQRTELIRSILDLQDNIVVLIAGVHIVFANKKFYSFFGYRDLTEFNASQSNISEFFIEKEHFFHPGKITEGTDWVEQISTLIDSKRVVSMRDINHQMHAFSVTVTDYGDQGNIVSFTDISETMSEHLALEEKTIHDQLTGAYNREYLEQKQARLISSFSQSRQHMGLALIDIDHFKAVNDSHGHDIGDKVLKQFVQIIQQNSRADDIVIRWGGEEFVLILRVNSEENLKCVLENLRKTVASVTFSKAGHQTCSIGGTIHRHDEPINETIKRADEALYQAKNSGRNNVVLAK